jgi:hypothetical protein
MLEDQAARLLVDAVKEEWTRDDVAKEINKNPALEESYFEGKPGSRRTNKYYAGGSELSKKILHYDQYPEGKYRFGKDQLPDWAKDELIEAGFDLESPLIKSSVERMMNELSDAGLTGKRSKKRKPSQAAKNRAAKRIGGE